MRKRRPLLLGDPLLRLAGGERHTGSLGEGNEVKDHEWNYT